MSAPRDKALDSEYRGPGEEDRAVGWFIAPDGKPYPSAGARVWAAMEVDRVLGPTAIGKRVDE